MKPNYCSGGAFASGRISSRLSSSSCSVCRTDRNGNNEKLSLGAQNQQQLNYRDSSSFSKTPSSTPSSSTTSPAFIVYRSAKYISPHVRALQTIQSYAKFYVVAPIALFANRCKDAFYQLFGLMLLLILSPFLVVMFIGLFWARRLRYILIKRLYPNLIHFEDYNSRTIPLSTATESHGIVNSIIWIKGKVDASTVRNRFKYLFAENPCIYNILRLKQVSKFGAKVWDSCPDFQIDRHIVEAPKTFHNYPLVDEPLKELYRSGSNNKSILQKYVSYCVSLPLDCTSPPWKIHIVPYISRDDDAVREKTCLVIRIHVALVRNSDVQQALRDLLLNTTLAPGGDGALCEKTNTDSIEQSNAVEDRNWAWGIFDIIFIVEFIKSGDAWRKLRKFVLLQQKNLAIWVNLRKKQLQFHSKAAVLSAIFLDMKDGMERFLRSVEAFFSKTWVALAHHVMNVITIMQAVAAVPMLILVCIMRNRHFKSLGLQKHLVPGKKLISWSDLIHGDLAEEISEKIGSSSSENVILMACLHALRDYYQQNNMEVPTKIGFILGDAVHASHEMKALHIPLAPKNIYTRFQHADELLSLERKLMHYPDWKILGLTYISNYSHYFLTSSLAHRLRRSILTTYPFTFTYVNLKCDSTLNCGQDFIPIRQLYGEVVEDFTFWPLPPLSDLGISITLIRSAGKSRLFVLSPFQSMDTVLTHRTNQFLIELAEQIGIDKSRIPYSRRSSPSSTSCSTPQIMSYVNPIDNLNFRSCMRRSGSLNATNF